MNGCRKPSTDDQIGRSLQNLYFSSDFLIVCSRLDSELLYIEKGFRVVKLRCLQLFKMLEIVRW